MKPITGLVVTGAVVGAFFVGGIQGADTVKSEQAASDKAAAEADQEVKVIHTETTVVKREPYASQPESCAEAVEAAKQTSDAFGNFDGEYGDLKELTLRLAASITNRSITDLNTAKQELFNYSSDSAGIATNLAEARHRLEQYLSECISDVNK